MGPFATHDKDLTLSLNPHAWNKIANMVFIEQPCGVGFSYSDEADPLAEGGDYITDDAQAKKDNYALIQAWLDRFPEYRKNDVSSALLLVLHYFILLLTLTCSPPCLQHSCTSPPRAMADTTCLSCPRRSWTGTLLARTLT
jgi:hypothetical protein